MGLWISDKCMQYADNPQTIFDNEKILCDKY
jgi:hypothetical protein